MYGKDARAATSRAPQAKRSDQKTNKSVCNEQDLSEKQSPGLIRQNKSNNGTFSAWTSSLRSPMVPERRAVQSSKRHKMHQGSESSKYTSGVKLLLPNKAHISSPADLSSGSSRNSSRVKEENLKVNDLLYHLHGLASSSSSSE